ncbi:bifunctional diguanylate cyclase/phosphodiesterase [Labrenzia aggregata]|uniref:Bifunctional diguanylate cyclase/phosphodiesterase n=2 Tax=Roseibium aggregatum TaxID=187304 RepID=A0A939J4J4_9HYPH|nr:bifunctional diguanylate cyclase/phosphodiesterase [Roseibium aggregatum]
MSLVLLLALGVYASNRLLTQWLLVRGLEQAFIPHKNDIRDILQTLEEKRKRQPPAHLSGLRLSTPETSSPHLRPDQFARLKDSLQLNSGTSAVVDAAVVFTGAPDPVGGVPDWYENNLLLSPDDLTKARAALTSNKALTAIPDMTWYGRFGAHAIMVFRPEDASEAMPGLLVLVTQSELLTSLAQPMRSITAAVGGLCLASFVFAGILLWMRFHDQVRTNRNIQYLAHHDTLTGLPNRAVFNARLNEALRLAQAKASNIGVMLIDVDKFKEINDTHGHGIGDVFLQIVGERLTTVFANHLVARLSGDEFAVMLTTTSDTGRMTRLATEMIAATAAPCVIDGREIKLSLSIGIARATDGSWRATRLLHCADLALYRAKHSGRSTFSWYTPELDAEAKKRKEIENGLIKALKFDQFHLAYQPQYSLKDGSLKGYEALIRWEHPSKGTIRPDVFVPIAEDTGLIEEIGTWVLNRACFEAAHWENTERRVAVNMSAAQFVAGESHKRVAQALQNSQLDPKRLEIEITESLLISNTDAVIETLRQIRDLGVSIAMDDFGTGYSSLSYLSLFPFDKIKIDKAFVQNLGKDASTDAIVTSIVGLGRSLDVTITAEGVETEEQAILLSAAGCDLVQGFMFGKPDTVEKHEANFPVFPLNTSGGRWFPQIQAARQSSQKTALPPKLSQYATRMTKAVDTPPSEPSA